MASAISTGAAALMYGYNALGYASEALGAEIDIDELPQGRIHPSMKEQINKELSTALMRKDISIEALRPRGNSEEITANGKAGSLATITLSPELFKGDAKVTEWRIARAIGTIQSDNLVPAVKKFGALAATALVAHLLLGAYCWAWVIAAGVTALDTYVTRPQLFDRMLDAESLKFANSVATQEQLEAGIRYLEEKVKAAEERHVERQEWLASYHPYLKEGYTRAHDLYEQYVPGVKTDLADTQQAYSKRFEGKSGPASASALEAPKAVKKEATTAAA